MIKKKTKIEKKETLSFSTRDMERKEEIFYVKKSRSKSLYPDKGPSSLFSLESIPTTPHTDFQINQP